MDCPTPSSFKAKSLENRQWSPTDGSEKPKRIAVQFQRPASHICLELCSHMQSEQSSLTIMSILKNFQME